MWRTAFLLKCYLVNSGILRDYSRRVEHGRKEHAFEELPHPRRKNDRNGQASRVGIVFPSASALYAVPFSGVRTDQLGCTVNFGEGEEAIQPLVVNIAFADVPGNY
jgi:hypothetical protein